MYDSCKAYQMPSLRDALLDEDVAFEIAIAM
jgi:hypothetical protein